MWEYEGSSDLTRVHPEEFDTETLEAKHMAITSAHDNPRGTRVIVPFDKDHLPIEVIPNFPDPSAFDVVI